MTPADVLRKAAERIERDGWRQGSLGIRYGEPCCAVGAMLTVPDSNMTAHRAAEQAMIEYVGPNGIPFWNDQPGRTKEQVLRTLRYVADRLDAHPDRDRGEGEA